MLKQGHLQMMPITSQLKDSIKTFLADIFTWCNANKLKINLHKTCYNIFKSRTKIISENLDNIKINNKIKIGHRLESLSFIASIGVAYLYMHHLKCKCSSEQEYLKLPCCTKLCARELIYPFSKFWH